MSHPKTADLEALLTALVEGGVEFIVVGGVAAVLHGAPITTQDLDIVHRCTRENVDRLLAVLAEIDAMFRPALGRQIRPTREMLSGSGQLNLTTSLGPLDPLCRLHTGQGYEELLAHTVVVSDGELRLKALDLETLIEVKAQAARAKDKLTLPILLALRDKLRD